MLVYSTQKKVRKPIFNKKLSNDYFDKPNVEINSPLKLKRCQHVQLALFNYETG